MAVLTHSLRFEVTPTTCKALMDAGYDVTVERSTQRIFDGLFSSPHGNCTQLGLTIPR
jgi:hypothetical protein